MQAQHKGKLEGMPAREDVPDKGLNANGYQDQSEQTRAGGGKGAKHGQRVKRAPSSSSMAFAAPLRLAGEGACGG